MPAFERRPSQSTDQSPGVARPETGQPERSMTADRGRMGGMGGAGGSGQQAGDLSVWGAAVSGDSGSAGGTDLDAVLRLERLCARIGQDDATGAREGAAQFAAERRSRLGIEDDALTRAAGRVWSAADRMARAVRALDASNSNGAKELAHQSAETLRAVRDEGLLSGDAVESAIARAGQLWTGADAMKSQQQSTNGQAGGSNAVWTTGRVGGRGGVTSREMDQGGDWSKGDWLSHHSDRSNSWAAKNIRNGKNQDLQAYDFTFERADANGKGIAGTAHGLELISPWDAKVHDVQHTTSGSGGYGLFIALEDLETGLRFEVHHLDSVADVRRGGRINGGDVIGTQGGSGQERYSFDTHVDIVGTAAAVEQFVRANQSGEFRTNKRTDGA